MDSYLLNPDYLLRQDGNRVILCSKRELCYGGEEWFTFIHPFQAMMLSFFNGENPLENEIANCARFFNIPFEKMHKNHLTFYRKTRKWFLLGISRDIACFFLEKY